MHGKEKHFFLPFRYIALHMLAVSWWVGFGFSVLSVGLWIVILALMVNSKDLLCVICGTPQPSNFMRTLQSKRRE